MKFVYGKQDWKTFERGEENCFLMTNGLGGFSSLTMIGSCSRNDHAVLMACLHSPNHRYNMIHRLEEIIRIGGETIHISSQDDADVSFREEGYLYQTAFTYEDYPRWTYLVKGVEVVRTMALMQGENTVGISYEIRNYSGEEITLEVNPHLQFVPKGHQLSKEQKFTIEDGLITSNGQWLRVKTDGIFHYVFAMSNNENEKELGNKKIYNIDELTYMKEDSIVILAISKRHMGAVREKLEILGFKNILAVE